MMAWVLVIWISTDAVLGQIEFKTEKACLEGQRQWVAVNKNYFTPRSVCMFRGQ